MKDVEKTRDQLVKQLEDMRKRVAELEVEASELNWAKDIINADPAADRQCPQEDEEAPPSAEDSREREEKFAKAFLQNSVPMAISTVKEGRYIDVSDAFLELMGLSREEVVGNTSTGVGFITPEQRAIVLGEFAKHGRVENLELEVRTKGGEIRHGLFNSSRITIGNEDVLLTVVTDITKRKHTEEALRASENLFRRMTNNLPGAVYQFYVGPNQEMGLYFVSEGAADLLGIQSDPQHFFPLFLERVLQEDREPLLESIREAARTVSRWEHEVRFMRPDGRLLFVRGFSQPRRIGHEIVFDGVLLDVTEQRRAECVSREVEARYRRLHDTMRDAFVSVDMEGHIMECNEIFLKMLGYELEEIIKLTFLDLTPEKWHEYEAEIVQGQVIPRGYSEVYEKEYRRKDGSVFPVELRTILFRDEAGRPVSMWATVRDITRRKEAERDLRQAITYNRNLIEASLDPLVTIGRDGKITDVNTATEQATGYARHQLIGSDFSDYFTEPQKARAGYLQVFKEGQVRDYELGLRHRGGNVTSVLYNASVYRDASGQAAGVFAASRDISERKKAEEALSESEAKYRFLTERMNDIVWTADMDFRLTYDSPSVEKVLGFTLQERMQQTAREMLTPESYTRILEVMAFELERDAQDGVDPDRTIKLELEYYHKDGSTVWMECVVSAIRDNAGKPVGIYGVSRNITDRKRMADELKRHKEQLEGIVQERTAELTRAYEHLKKENDARKTSEASLKAREIELEKGRSELEEMNAALKVLLRQREDDKQGMEMNIVSNITVSVLPYLDKLSDSGLREDQERIVSMVRSLLGDVISPFVRNVSSEYFGLTPSEIQVASLIKEGKSSKDIARIMSVSLNTVHTYRYKIRTKTRLKNNKVNLRSYLQTLE